MIKVIAVRKGTIDGRAILPGEVFDIDEKLFADVNDVDAHQATFGWMQRIDEGKLQAIKDKRKTVNDKTAEEDKKQREKFELYRPLSAAELDSYVRGEAEAKQAAKLAPIVVQGNMLPKWEVDEKAVKDAEAQYVGYSAET